MKKRTGSSAAALLDDIEDRARPSRPSSKRAEPMRVRPVLPRETGAGYDGRDEDTTEFVRSSAARRRIRRGLTLRTQQGRWTFGIGALVLVGTLGASGVAANRYLNTSPRFLIASSEFIEFEGNHHVSRAQMLNVFGEDIERNLFHVPMADRRSQLESIPWVEHATVMRLLPNHIRVDVTERKPVAFVRQAGNIGMVDATGVLLDVPPDAPGNPDYSFPVLTGLTPAQTPQERHDRVALYLAFVKDLDSDGQHTSARLSEIDVSDPEDVKALLQDRGSDILVHFGNQGFLARYRRFQDHIVEWHSQYPRLTGVDLRYDSQAVLQMPPKDASVQGGEQGAATSGNAHSAAEKPSPATPAKVAVTSSPAHAGTKPAPRPAKAPHRAKAAASQQDMQKRVQQIREWMLKRQQQRAAAAARSQ